MVIWRAGTARLKHHTNAIIVKPSAPTSPDEAAKLHEAGIRCIQKNDWSQAADLIGKSLAIDPRSAEAQLHFGIAMAAQGRRAEALEALTRALALRSHFARALSVRSGVYHELGLNAEALADIDKALAIEPYRLLALNNRGSILMDLNRLPEAVAALTRALSVDPGYAPALFNRGAALRGLQRLEDAWADLHKARASMPGAGQVASEYFYVSALLCDWKEREGVDADFARRIDEGQSLHPWQVLIGMDDPERQLRAARAYAAPATVQRPASRAARGARLRIAYLSPDFREHATGFQLAELLESHDRSHFETFGISLHAAEDSPLRRRLIGSFDHFLELGAHCDQEVARTLSKSGIDIAVDLAGYVSMGRTRALSFRPAPIAVNYYGYPGTLGADFIDYIIADSHIVPEGSEKFYAEQVVRLPGSYYPTDTKRAAAPRPSRADAGLPERGFVFCTFNNSYKFTPGMFDIWMRLLNQVENSVLWIYAENGTARANLRTEAQARGVSPARLVFAERVDHAQQLARLALADLFLDTAPCNAHTTASDALWAGVPLITHSGRGFAARVAGSLLAAIGLEELITTELADYEALALALARSPKRLTAIRERLWRNRSTHPLFDTARLCRNIESAYRTMWEIHQRGEMPRSFSVAP